MKSYANKLLLALVALIAVSATPLHAGTGPNTGTFFSPQYFIGDDEDGNPVYYLDYFNTFTYDPSDESYVYKYNFGWLYNFGPSGPSDNNDAYFYDYRSDDIFYTAPDLYPYFYSFNKDNFLYYYEDTDRVFYDFSTMDYLYDY